MSQAAQDQDHMSQRVHDLLKGRKKRLESVCIGTLAQDESSYVFGKITSKQQVKLFYRDMSHDDSAPLKVLGRGYEICMDQIKVLSYMEDLFSNFTDKAHKKKHFQHVMHAYIQSDFPEGFGSIQDVSLQHEIERQLMCETMAAVAITQLKSFVSGRVNTETSRRAMQDDMEDNHEEEDGDQNDGEYDQGGGMEIDGGHGTGYDDGFGDSSFREPRKGRTSASAGTSGLAIRSRTNGEQKRKTISINLESSDDDAKILTENASPVGRGRKRARSPSNPMFVRQDHKRKKPSNNAKDQSSIVKDLGEPQEPQEPRHRGRAARNSGFLPDSSDIGRSKIGNDLNGGRSGPDHFDGPDSIQTAHFDGPDLVVDGERYGKGEKTGQFRKGWVRHHIRLIKHNNRLFRHVRYAFKDTHTKPLVIDGITVEWTEFLPDTKGAYIFKRRRFEVDGVAYMEYEMAVELLC